MKWKLPIALGAAVVVVLIVGLDLELSTPTITATRTSSTGNSPSATSASVSAIISGNCPQNYNTSAYPEVNKVRLIPASANSMKVLAVMTGPSPSAMAGSGQIAWCLYNPSEILESSYETDRVLSSVAAAAGGSDLAAVGWQTLPGPAGEYANGAVDFFNQDGKMVWNITSPKPFFEVEGDANDSVIIVNDPELLYVNHSGQILWNYSGFESISVVLVNNGSDVVAGVSQILYPGHTNFGGALTMFNSKGVVMWNDTLPDYSFASTGSVVYSAGHIAAGLSAGGQNSSLNYYNLQGGLVWSRYIASFIGAVAFEDGGSAITAETNLGNMTFSLSGNLVSNQTVIP